MSFRLAALGGVLCLCLTSCRSDNRCAARPAPLHPSLAEAGANESNAVRGEGPASASPVSAPDRGTESNAGVARSEPTDEPKDEILKAGHDDLVPPPAPTAAPGELPEPLFVEGESALVGLTLADVEAMALANNPSLQVAAFGVGERLGVRTQVGLRANPEFGYSGQEIGNSGEAGQQGVYLSQTFVRGRKLELNRAVAQWDTAEANWIAETQRYRVLNDVRSAFYDALGAQRRKALAAELVTLAEKGVETSRSLLEAGQAARPDLLQAEIQLSEVGIVLRNAEIAYESAWNQLVSLAGQPYLVPIPLTGELQEELPAVEWEYAYETLVALSPELQRAEARIERSRCLIARQSAQPIPNLLTQFAVANDFSTNDVVTNVQIGIPLPIHNRNQGNLRAAVAEYHRATRDAERIRLSLRERLAVTVREFAQAQQQVQRYRDEIVPKSRESYDLINAGYAEGEFDFLRVLTARRTLFESQLTAVQSLVALNRAHVALEGLLLTGGLDAVPEANDSSGLRDQALNGQ